MPQRPSRHHYAILSRLRQLVCELGHVEQTRELLRQCWEPSIVRNKEERPRTTAIWLAAPLTSTKP